MSNLQTQYLGIPLASPVVVGASSISKRIETIQHLEDAGAGALVIKSLFEEQVQLERAEFDDNLSRYDNAFQEAVNLFPRMNHAGAREHIFWVQKTRKAVGMPLIGSLNCVTHEAWTDYAVQLADTGVDALELNFYSSTMDVSVSGDEIEKREVDVVAAVCSRVKIPVSVKLHPYYTNLARTVSEMEKAGAKGFVLFNRLFQPDINMSKIEKRAAVHLSSSHDGLQALRWVGLLNQRLRGSVAGAGGIESGQDVAKMILVGASAVQVVSSLYRNGPTHVSRMNDELLHWMREHNFDKIDDFRGILGKRRGEDLWSFERGQYIKAILGFD